MKGRRQTRRSRGKSHSDLGRVLARMEGQTKNCELADELFFYLVRGLWRSSEEKAKLKFQIPSNDVDQNFLLLHSSFFCIFIFEISEESPHRTSSLAALLYLPITNSIILSTIRNTASLKQTEIL